MVADCTVRIAGLYVSVCDNNGKDPVGHMDKYNYNNAEQSESSFIK